MRRRPVVLRVRRRVAVVRLVVLQDVRVVRHDRTCSCVYTTELLVALCT